MQMNPAPPDSTPPDERLRVLVVGSHAAAIEAAACSGYRLLVCPDGAAALRSGKANPPDVVLLDNDLPDLDGRQVAKSLRGVGAGKRPFLILLNCPGGATADAAEAEIDLTLPRPVNLPWLRRLLRRLQAIVLPDDAASRTDARTTRRQPLGVS